VYRENYICQGGIIERRQENLMTAHNKPVSTLPKSPTSVLINLIALDCVIVAFILIRKIGINLTTLYAVIICLLALAIPIIVLEAIFLKPYRRVSAGLDFSIKHRWDLQRAVVKLLGFYFTIALVALVYWLFPEYHRDCYGNYWTFVKVILPPLLIAAIPYFIIIDHFMLNPQDGYWDAGMVVLGQWSRIDRKIFGQHLLGWLVKTFFLPLMFIGFFNNVEYLRKADFCEVLQTFDGFYNFVRHAFFTVDLLFVTVGYAVSVRLFDSHLRSTEPTILGWLVALQCYEPFWWFSSNAYLKYLTDFTWKIWLSGHPIIYAIWGIAILLLLLIYVYATIPFGIRFSNLTNRGILTNGPYRFCKHPAYVSKNLSWWLVSIPFLSQGGILESLRLSLLLLCLNIIYFLRARTEERHLSSDPVYVEYAMVMNERSIFAWMGKLLPLLQFRPFGMFNLKDQN